MHYLSWYNPVANFENHPLWWMYHINGFFNANWHNIGIVIVTLVWFFLQDLILYCKLPKTSPLKWSIRGVLVSFIIQKLKSKHLVCNGFLWWQVFLREQEKIFCRFSRPRLIVFAVYGKWRNMTSICQFPGWGSHPSSFLPSIQSIDPIFFPIFFSDLIFFVLGSMMSYLIHIWLFYSRGSSKGFGSWFLPRLWLVWQL